MAQKMNRTLEAYHGMIYFCPEAAAEYLALGATHARTGYFASRSAPMGAVSAEVVTATFFNFNPALVNAAMSGAWEVAEPAAWTAARLRGADGALRRFLGDTVQSDEMARAADVARRAAEACWAAGRPLAGGLLGLAWPEPAHLVLWHALSIIREFRGDGHVAALVASNVTPMQALLLHGGAGAVPSELLRTMRDWPESDWANANQALQGRGLLGADGLLTAAGQEFRDAIEDQTNVAGMAPWEALGQTEVDELRGLVRGYSKAIVAGGAFNF